jgi:hypothetical protein
MSRFRGTEVMKLVACKACGYIACICLVQRDHVSTCLRRRVLLAEYSPEPCPHDVVACGECFPCTCEKENGDAGPSSG